MVQINYGSTNRLTEVVETQEIEQVRHQRLNRPEKVKVRFWAKKTCRNPPSLFCFAKATQKPTTADKNGSLNKPRSRLRG